MNTLPIPIRPTWKSFQTSVTGKDTQTPLKIFVVAGEISGDALAVDILDKIAKATNRPLEVMGIAGPELMKRGVYSIFPIEEIAVMGISAVVRHLPRLLRRIKQTADLINEVRPDLVIAVDSPDFNHRVAKRVRSKNPEQPMIKVIAPSVWAWRPGRAKKMKPLYDHVLAILPFEPAVMKQLDGPPTTYIGHPLSHRIKELRPSLDDMTMRKEQTKIVILPGSRLSELKRHMPILEQAIGLIQSKIPAAEFILPTVSHLETYIRKTTQAWKTPITITTSLEDKWKSFKQARVALAASGTVTLELALTKTPMVVFYKVDPIAYQLRFLVKVQSIVLANLVAQNNVIKELINRQATPQTLAKNVIDVMTDTTAHEKLMNHCETVIQNMNICPQERQNTIKSILEPLLSEPHTPKP